MKIRVDPDLLLSNSKRIINISSEIKHISETVRNAANSAPSYNGQFGPKVKSIGKTAYSDGMKNSDFLKSASSDLSVRAQRFSNTDSKSIFGDAVVTFASQDKKSKKKKNIWDWFKQKWEDVKDGIIEIGETIIEGVKDTIEDVFDIVKNIGGSLLNLVGGTIEGFGEKFGIHSLDNFGAWMQDYGQKMRASGKWAKSDIKQTTEDQRRVRYGSDVPPKLKDAWKECGCPIPGTDGYLAFLLTQYTSAEKPISILKNGENDYIVLIKGTNGELTDIAHYFEDENGWGNNVAAFLGYQTGYEKTVLDLIRDSIPAGATIHFVGHSQGGIIANNCVADALAMGYNVDSVTTFGAPPPINYNQPYNVDCTYYAALKDDVPQLSSYYAMAVTGTSLTPADLQSGGLPPEHIDIIMILQNRIEQLTNGKLTYINGKTDGTNVDAHSRTESYLKDDTLRHTTSGFTQDTAHIQEVAYSQSKPYQAGNIHGDETLKKV